MPPKPKRQASQVAQSKQFQFSTPSVFLCVARKYSGKSHLIKYILYNLIQQQKFDYGLIISPTISNGQWGVVPEEYQHDSWSDEVITRLINKQKAFAKQGQKVECFLVLDDVLGSVNLGSKLFTFLITAGRQLGITVFLISQKWTSAIPPIVRQNSEYIILLRQPDAGVIKQLWIEYGSNYGTLQEWMDLFKNDVQDFRALLINNWTQSNKKEDIYATIKAPKDLPDWYFDWTQQKD